MSRGVIWLGWSWCSVFDGSREPCVKGRGVEVGGWMWHKEKKCQLPRDGILVLVSLGRMWTSPVSTANWLMPEGQLLDKSLLDATRSCREHLPRVYITSSPLLSAPWTPQATETSAQCLWAVWSTSPSQSMGSFLTQLNKTIKLLAYFLQSSALCYPPPGKLGCADRTSLFALVPIPKPRTKPSNRRLQNLEIIQPHPT